MRKLTYHICYKSEFAMFRVYDDYFTGILKLAMSAHYSDTSILAFTFMSNHLHIVAEGNNIVEFVRLFKQAYTMTFNNTYGNSGRVFDSVKFRELIDDYSIKIVLNYVLKNPIHHKIALVPFNYQFSSISIYYLEDLLNIDMITAIKHRIPTIAPNDLTKTEKRELFGKRPMPSNFRFRDRKYLVASSFVNKKRVREIYGSVNSFIYNMIRPVAEDYKAMKEIQILSILNNDISQNQDSNVKSPYAERTISEITDIKVCTLIEKLYPNKSFLNLSAEEIEHIKYLAKYKYNISPNQLARCLWLTY